MSNTQWALNVLLLVWVLSRNLGVREVTRSMFVVPLVIVVTAAAGFLRDVPTVGNDWLLEAVGAGAGLALGVLAAFLCRVETKRSRVTVTAGLGFAALWVAVIGGRMLFAAWAQGPGAASIGAFSRDHLITGAGAWTAAFVLMALAMVAGRLVTLAIQLARVAGPVGLAQVRS